MQQLTTALKLLWNTPSYVFGRFHGVRTTYSNVQRVRQLFTPPATLAIGEPYSAHTQPLQVRPSGLLVSTRAAGEHITRLRREAYSDGLQLSAAACAQLVELAKQQPLHTAGDTITTYTQLMQDASKREGVALATVMDVVKNEVIRSLCADPLLVEVVQGYLGYRPERVSPWMFWSPTNRLSDAEREAGYQTVRFHYDVHHYNFMYVNFYLLDTTERTGAHVLIVGSHRDKRARHLLGSVRISDAQALADYGPERIRTIATPAAHGFFEDTSCYHKALAPIDRERLMLQLRYQ